MLLNLGSKSFQPTTILFVWIIIPQSLGESCIEELNEFTVPFTDVGRLALVDRYVDGSGQVRIKGNGNLKGSQSYPVQFLYSNLLFSICLDHLALCIRSSRNRTLPDLHQKMLSFLPLATKQWEFTLPPSHHHPQARFGRSLSRLRTRHMNRLRTRARGLIKQNIKNCHTFRKNTRKNRLWERCGNLKEVFEFLS